MAVHRLFGRKAFQAEGAAEVRWPGGRSARVLVKEQPRIRRKRSRATGTAFAISPRASLAAQQLRIRVLMPET